MYNLLNFRQQNFFHLTLILFALTDCFACLGPLEGGYKSDKTKQININSI